MNGIQKESKSKVFGTSGEYVILMGSVLNDVQMIEVYINNYWWLGNK